MPREMQRIKKIPDYARAIGHIQRSGDYSVEFYLFVRGHTLYAKHITPDHPPVFERSKSLPAAIHYLWRIWEAMRMMQNRGELVARSGMFNATPVAWH